MSKELFDSGRRPMCEYCLYSKRDGVELFCDKKSGAVAEAVCRKYTYDPTKRVPIQEKRLPQFSPEDFEIG